MALTRFTQEPGYPDGAGLFESDDGSSFFAHDPDMAAQLSQPSEMAIGPYGPPHEDERTAILGFPDTEKRLAADAAGGQQAPAPPPSASDVQPAMVGRPEAPPPQAAPQAQESPALGQAEQLQQNVDAYAMRPVRVAATRGGVVPTTQSEVRETQGMP